MNTRATQALHDVSLNWGFFLEKRSHFYDGGPVVANLSPFRLEKPCLLCAALKLRAFR